MRRSLRWTLAAVAVLSAAALWLDEGPAKVVAALERRVASSPFQPTSTTNTIALAELPRQLEPLSLEPARRDIFVPVEPPAPKIVAPPPVVAPPPSPPAPTAPSMTWRYLGAMTTPEGQRLVMLARGDTTTLIQPGTRLEEGYVVEAIGADAVRLVYPPLGTVVDLPIPPAQSTLR